MIGSAWPSDPLAVGWAARTNAAGCFFGASKYQFSSGRFSQIRRLEATSSPNRKIGCEAPSAVSTGRNAGRIAAPTADGLRASPSWIGRSGSSGVRL